MHYSTDQASFDQRFARPRSADLVLGLLLVVVAAIGAWHLAGRVPVQVLDGKNLDIYFSSDTSRVHANMVQRESDHWRTVVHPIFSLLLHPAYHVMAWASGADLSKGSLSPGAVSTANLMSGLSAGIVSGLFFSLLRLAGVRRFDALLFCVLAFVCSFSFFWFTIPETYPWGAATILAALVLVAWADRQQLPAWSYVAASMLTLSCTTTNWMVGIFAAWTRFKLVKCMQVTIIALGLTFSLAVVQKLIFPSSWLFIRFGGERSYVMQADSGGPVRCLSSIFTHTIVMPEITASPHKRYEGKTVLRTQFSNPGSGSAWGKLALLCWVFLLLAGGHALLTLREVPALRLTLGLSILGQTTLHTIYGSETFLYAAHYGPLLVVAAALGTLTRFRVWVIGVGGVLIVCLYYNNTQALQHTIDLLQHYAVK
jgi:hypothetical protein